MITKSSELIVALFVTNGLTNKNMRDSIYAKHIFLNFLCALALFVLNVSKFKLFGFLKSML